MRDEQFCFTDSINETAVELSAMMCRVVFCVADLKGASKRGPPGLVELSASPYW